MCGIYTLASSPEEIRERFGLGRAPANPRPQDQVSQADRGMYFILRLMQLIVRPDSRSGVLRYKIAPKCLLPGPFGHSGVGGNPGVAGTVRSYNLVFTYPCQGLPGGTGPDHSADHPRQAPRQDAPGVALSIATWNCPGREWGHQAGRQPGSAGTERRRHNVPDTQPCEPGTHLWEYEATLTPPVSGRANVTIHRCSRCSYSWDGAAFTTRVKTPDGRSPRPSS